MKAKKYFAMAAVILLMGACSKSDDISMTPTTPPQPAGTDNQPTGTISFTATVTNQENVTRALSDGTNKVVARWQVNEQMALIYTGGGTTYNKTATITSVDSEGNAVVSATLEGEVTDNMSVSLVYPASATNGNSVKAGLLDTQDGTLNSISNELDLRQASAHIYLKGNTATLRGHVNMEQQYAICKFTIQDASSNSLSINELTIKDGGTVLTTVSPSSETSELWVAMAPTTNNLTFEATNSAGEEFKKTGTAALSAGYFYQPTMKMDQSKFIATSSNLDDKITAFNATKAENPELVFPQNESISEWKTITRNDGVIDMNGSSLDGFYVQNDDVNKSITVKNGTVAQFDGTSGWDDFYNGVVVLENMTVTSRIWTDGSHYKLYRTSCRAFENYKVNDKGQCIVEIYDGSIIGNTTLTNGGINIYTTYPTGTFVLYGGKYTTPAKEWLYSHSSCASGYSFKPNTESDAATYPWIVSKD